MFGWKMARIRTNEHFVEYNNEKCKIYRIHGNMFFGTTAHFIDLFDYNNDLEQVIIDFKNSHLWDFSAINAISKVKDKYDKANKTISLTGLNRESHELLIKTGLINP